ncbi:MAG: MFS transporter [Chloroflexi bacterium]|nr:MFS transporter [Chloroflexota bacterium]
MSVSATLPVERATRREHWAWYLYDFGNSAFAAVILLAVYATYFQGTVVGGAEGSRLWGLSIGIAMLVVAIISPVLGSIADFSASKKEFLFFFTIICIIFTALLFFVRQGSVFTGMLFFILAEIGYRSSQVFYDSILPDIAKPEEMGRISGNGWAIGSFGGIVCLLIVLALITLIGGQFIVRISFVITAVFFAISTIPMFVWYKNHGTRQNLKDHENHITVAFGRLSRTFKELKNFRELLKFFAAFLIYNDGIIMTLDFAAIYGAVMYGLESQQLIIFMIIVQVTSVIGAYLFGILADRVQGKLSLAISLILMIAVITALYFNKTLTGFFILGGVAGFALTGVQSVSRMLVGQLSPKDRSGEFYGFFAVIGRTSSFIGPAIYGWLAAEIAISFESKGYLVEAAEKTGQQIAMQSVNIFLIIGLIILMFVNFRKGQKTSIEVTNEG